MYHFSGCKQTTSQRPTISSSLHHSLAQPRRFSFLRMTSISRIVAANISLRGLPSSHSMSGTKISGLSKRVSDFDRFSVEFAWRPFYSTNTNFSLAFYRPENSLRRVVVPYYLLHVSRFMLGVVCARRPLAPNQ